MKKKDKIKEASLKSQEKLESKINLLKDFIILQHHPKQEQSRFSEFFKELADKEKEKQKFKEEPKIEKKEKSEQNKLKKNEFDTQSPNQRFDSSDRSSSYFSFSQYQNPNCENNNIINDPNS